jgi:hypothetical protein
MDTNPFTQFATYAIMDADATLEEFEDTSPAYDWELDEPYAENYDDDDDEDVDEMYDDVDEDDDEEEYEATYADTSYDDEDD